MDKVLFISGLIAAFGALDIFAIAFFVFRSMRTNLNLALDREYGPELELYENGVRCKTAKRVRRINR